MASATTSRPKDRFALLDLSRFGAALVVVAFHYTATNSAPWGQEAASLFPRIAAVSKYGPLGVDLFFLISGFVILMTAYRRTKTQFIASRASRVFPAMWAAIILGAFLYWVLWPEGGEIAFRDVLTNFTLIVEPLESNYIDGVFWTLWVELRFYALILLFMCWGITQRRIMTVAVVWPVIAFIAQESAAWELTAVLMPRAAPLFAGGMVLFTIYRWGWSWFKASILVSNAIWATILSVDGVAGTIARNTSLGSDNLKLTFAVLGIFALVTALVTTPLRKIRSRWMTWLGLFTYPLYLVHEIWGWYVIDLLAGSVSPYLVLLSATALAIFLAYFIIRLVEKPWAPRMRNRISKDLERMTSQDDEEMLDELNTLARENSGASVRLDFVEKPNYTKTDDGVKI